MLDAGLFKPWMFYFCVLTAVLDPEMVIGCCEKFSFLNLSVCIDADGSERCKSRILIKMVTLPCTKIYK
jgi:hypothetical protein